MPRNVYDSLARNKTIHQDQHLYGGELSWWGVVRIRLFSNDLQFEFKGGLSTTLCTSMIQGTLSYFNHEGSDIYGLLLEASTATIPGGPEITEQSIF